MDPPKKSDFKKPAFKKTVTETTDDLDKDYEESISDDRPEKPKTSTPSQATAPSAKKPPSSLVFFTRLLFTPDTQITRYDDHLKNTPSLRKSFLAGIIVIIIWPLGRARTSRATDTIYGSMIFWVIGSTAHTNSIMSFQCISILSRGFYIWEGLMI